MEGPKRPPEATPALGLSATTRACLFAAVTAAATMLSQVLVHRVVSAKLLNNYAFLVISLTMLGFAFSGVLLTRWLRRVLERLDDHLVAWSAGFVISLLGSTMLFYHLRIGTSLALDRTGFIRSVLGWVPLALLFAVPFVFCGLILGTLLASPRLPTRRVYFFDLMGSAVGAWAVIPAIGRVGVESSILLTCALVLVAAPLLAPPTRMPARVAWASALMALIATTAMSGRAFDMFYPEGTMLAAARDPASGRTIEHVQWDPVGRIEVSRIRPPDPDHHPYPCLIGTDRDFLDRLTHQLTQNNYAFTYAIDYDGRPENLRGIEETIYAAAYHASEVERPRVAIVGVGGGFDVLTALRFNASEVVGIEINSATVDVVSRVLRSEIGRWLDDPRVELVAAEGRYHLATTDQRFDILQLSGVDSYSGTPGAAHVFSENYLYTSEAFDLYLSRLSDDGIINLMRLEHSPPREMLRALTTAVEALRRAGIEDPSRHIVMVAADRLTFVAMLVKRTPFTDDQVAAVSRWAGGNPLLRIVASPSPNPLPGSAYESYLQLSRPETQAAYIATYPFDISPVSDNRPFFFRYSFWWHLIASEPSIRSVVPFMEYSTIILLAVMGLAAVLCVYLPLRVLAARGLATPGVARHVLFFAGIGLGFLAIEIALLQRFGLFLGHPNYALSVVLAALLCSSGLGSVLSDRIMARVRHLRYVSYGLAVLVIVQHLLILPRLQHMLGLPFAVKVVVVGALILPLGLAMGIFFPTAVERLKPTAPDFVPWAWGVNGIFSVIAPVAGVAISITWGIGALFLSAVPIYLAVGMVAFGPDSARR